MASTSATGGGKEGAPSSSATPIPEEVQTLFQKRARIKLFVAQFEEELLLLEKLGEACADLATFKERAKSLTLYGPGQPSQVQLKIDLNEWMTAQNNALMKADIIEVYVKEYRRQMGSYESEISKRGFVVDRSGALVPAATAIANATASAATVVARPREEARSEEAPAEGSAGSSAV